MLNYFHEQIFIMKSNLNHVKHLDKSLEAHLDQVFTEKLLQKMLEVSIPLQDHLDKSKLDGVDHGIRIVKKLGRIDIREIHPPGQPIFYRDKNGKSTGKIASERGYQTRMSTPAIDADHRKPIEKSIKNNNWVPQYLAPVYFRLPKDQEYDHPVFHGVKVKYGVFEGCHRTESARNTGQKHIIGYLVEFDLANIYYLAGAVFNTEAQRQMQLNYIDHAEGIIAEIQENKSVFGKKFNAIVDTDERDKLINKIINKYTQNKTVKKEIKKYLSNKNIYSPKVKPFNQTDAANHVEASKDWRVADDVFDKNNKKINLPYDYEHNTIENLVGILAETKGSNDSIVFGKCLRILKDYPNKRITIILNPSSDNAKKQKDTARQFRIRCENMIDLYRDAKYDNLDFHIQIIPKTIEDRERADQLGVDFLEI